MRLQPVSGSEASDSSLCRKNGSLSQSSLGTTATAIPGLAREILERIVAARR